MLTGRGGRPSGALILALTDIDRYPAGRKRARQIVTAFHKTEAELAALEQQQAQDGLDPGTKAERLKE